MKAMTKIEREELLAKIDGLNQRIVDLERDERMLREKIEQLDEDVANGKAGAKAEAIRLDEKARAAHLEIEACQRAASTAQRRWEDDEPFRDAEREAARKTQREEACRFIYASAHECDEIARSLMSALSDVQRSLEPAVAAGVDPHVQHQMLLQYVFQPMLVAAGFGSVRSEWAGTVAQSLEDAARQHVWP